MGRVKLDLQVHTHFSDGKLSPLEAITHAAERGVEVIAFTDHDDVRAWSRDSIEGMAHHLNARLQTAGKGMLKLGELQIVQGIECTSGYTGPGVQKHREITFLGLFVDGNALASHDAKFASVKAYKTRRGLAMVERLNDMLDDKSLALSQEDIYRAVGPGTVNSLHIAHALWEKISARTPNSRVSVKFIHERYFGRGERTAYIATDPYALPGHEEVIRIILEAGGIPILPHPFSFRGINVEKVVGELQRVSQGLGGVETDSPGISTRARQKLIAIAEKHKAVASVGSNYHGWNYNPNRSEEIGVTTNARRYHELLKRRDRICASNLFKRDRGDAEYGS